MAGQPFRMSDLKRVAEATHEEICIGDFVRLASGGPIGIVKSVGAEQANVAWLTEETRYSLLPWVCLRVARPGGGSKV